MLYVIIFLLLATLSYWFWRDKYIDQQVARNLAAFKADGANDSLQRGFHSRETWRRVWVGLACCVAPAAPLAFASWGAAALGFLSVAALLAGAFARDFTPKLNLARIAAGETWITEWGASPASKSWPDAAAWKKVRAAAYIRPEDQQAKANEAMEQIVLNAWHWCLLAAVVLAGVAGWVAIVK